MSHRLPPCDHDECPPTRCLKRGSLAAAQGSEIGVELFELVQSDQGHAFVSDAIEDAKREDVLAMARVSLRHTEACARKLRRFIRKHSPNNQGEPRA